MLNLSPARLKMLSERVLLFAGLSVQEVGVVVKQARANTIGDGDIVVEEGDFGRSLVLLLSGQAHVIREMGGRSEVLAVLDPGATIGEMALLDPAPRSAQVVAHGSAMVLHIEPSGLNRLASQIQTKVFRNLAVILTRRLRAANRRMETISRRSSPTLPSDNDVREAGMNRWNLEGVDAEHVNLSGANLRQADLSYADLRGANLRGCLLDDAQISRPPGSLDMSNDGSINQPSDPEIAGQTEEHWESLMASLGRKLLPDGES